MRKPLAALDPDASMGWVPIGIAFFGGGYGTPIDFLVLAWKVLPIVGNGKVNPDKTVSCAPSDFTS
jgi:hypothetical protein